MYQDHHLKWYLFNVLIVVSKWLFRIMAHITVVVNIPPLPERENSAMPGGALQGTSALPSSAKATLLMKPSLYEA